MKKRILIKLLWGIPLLIYAADASAWGLFTHIYFAQYIALSLPILDPRLQNAIKKFPKLVMAGACLPDLALVSKHFNTTHQWHQAQEMLAQAKSDEEIAIAVGYTSHLYVDVIAHNHFVPAFEAKWLNPSILTHVVAEWAMDAHIAKHIETRPYGLLKHHTDVISILVAPCFKVSQTEAKKAVTRLAYADKTLRFSKLSSMLLQTIKRKDDEFIKKLDYYRSKTKEALQNFESTLSGTRPTMEAELLHLSATEMHAWREKCLIDARLRLTTPLQFHQAHSEQLQILHA
ncbi:MAG TPA: hypothetical protein DCO68_06810 [Methylophilaceae bacterium]|nr:hypothetical protein [Methylophilaceae bacterium]